MKPYMDLLRLLRHKKQSWLPKNPRSLAKNRAQLERHGIAIVERALEPE
jgi:hypothetical protein